MKILRMTASFGRLERQTLELSGGLNVLTAPNEAGKSTWAAFITAMLYGVDSSERQTKTNLPVKTRYKPWSGAPMEGSMEILWNGRRITLERTSRGRVPMGEFRAFDSETGAAVGELTGENCGLTLLGVPRSVFERSAFLGSRNLAVTPDAELEKRLSSLVTTGDETVSFQQSAQRLRDWKNRCQHNKTGLLPQKQAELGETEAALNQIREAHRNDLALTARRDELAARQLGLTADLAALRAQETARRLAQKRQAEQAAAEAAARAEKLRQELAGLPAPETLQQFARALSELGAEAARLPAAPPPVPDPPAPPAALAGLREDELLPKAQRDGARFDRLAAVKRLPGVWSYLLFALAAACAAAAILSARALPGAAAAVLAVLGAAWLLRARAQNRKYETAQDELDELLTAYDRHSRDEFVVLAAQYREATLLWRQARERADESLRETARQKQSLAERRARLLGQISMFAPGVQGTEEAQRAIADAEARHAAAAEAAREAAVSRQRFEAIRTALGELQEPPASDRDVAGRDPAQVSRELLELNSRLQDARSQLDLSRGRVDALGDPAALESRAERLRAEIAALQERWDALSLAEDTLAAASAELQTRFAPRVGELAGELLDRLTGSRYDRVFLDGELNLSARETGEPIARQLPSLSCGTADQLYLAVRLAICRLVLGPEAPLVLDDALVNFDDERMARALDVLREEAASRQILLFTCQARERAALSAAGPEK